MCLARFTWLGGADGPAAIWSECLIRRSLIRTRIGGPQMQGLTCERGAFVYVGRADVESVSELTISQFVKPALGKRATTLTVYPLSTVLLERERMPDSAQLAHAHRHPHLPGLQRARFARRPGRSQPHQEAGLARDALLPRAHGYLDEWRGRARAVDAWQRWLRGCGHRRQRHQDARGGQRSTASCRP